MGRQAVLLTGFSVLALLLSGQAAYAEALRLMFHDTVTSQSAGGAGKPIEEKTQISDDVVTLYPDSFSVENDREMRHYDIPKRRMDIFDKTQHTMLHESLYSVPIFLIREKQNRTIIAGALAAAKIDIKAQGGNADIQPVDRDNTLGSERDSEATASQVAQVEERGKAVFAANGIALADFRLSKVSIPASLRGTYNKFVVYETHVHPVVKRALSDSAAVFESLTHHHRETFRTEDGTMNLTGSKLLQDALYVAPAGYTEIHSRKPALNTLIDRGLAGPGPTISDYQTQIGHYIDQQASLDAFLAMMELTIVYPRADQRASYSAFFKESLDKVAQNADVARVRAILASPAKTDTELDEQVKDVTELRPRAPKRAYVLDLLLANNIWGVSGKKGAPSNADFEKKKLAYSLYMKALEGDPWLAGAYADLGAAYFADFDVAEAWSCWDAARQMNPDLSNLQSVNSFEKRALSDFPEYF